MNRHDANKLLYILNQIDNTAREENPEEVAATWQQALVLVLFATLRTGHWDGLTYTPLAKLAFVPQILVGVAVVVLALALHRGLRRLAAYPMLRGLRRDQVLAADQSPMLQAVSKNSKAWWRSVAFSKPRGWNRRARNQLDAALADADRCVQALNDRFVHPSGAAGEAAESEAEAGTRANATEVAEGLKSEQSSAG